MSNPSKKLSLRKGLFWIILSVFVFNGSAFLILQFFLNTHQTEKSPLRIIVQTGPEKEPLTTEYLAELMHISEDQPLYFHEFDCKKATKALLSSPVIKEAQVKLIKPDIIFVDYTIRHPIALLADFENMAIDEDKHLFPLSPFYAPKNLPQIYLEIPHEMIQWNIPLRGEKIDLALEVLKTIDQPAFRELFNVKCIDVSKAFENSYGKREIVISLEEEQSLFIEDQKVKQTLPRLLRLTPKNYPQEINNYLKLRERLFYNTDPTAPSAKRQKVIDFRVPELAFIDEK